MYDSKSSYSRRQISDPVAHPQYGDRTGFLSRLPGPSAMSAPTYRCSIQGPKTPSSSHRFRVRSLFHRSPLPLQDEISNESSEKQVSPPPQPHVDFDTTPTPKLTQLPLSLRRGSITPPQSLGTQASNTPPYKLRTKASNYSLRKQMSQHRVHAARRQDSVSERGSRRSDISRQDSRETIKIKMSSPVQIFTPPATVHNPLFPPRNSVKAIPDKQGLWLSYQIPPNDSGNGSTQPQELGTPYTPSKYGGRSSKEMLSAWERPRAADRNTTFSALMERAGIKEADILGRRR